MHYQLPNDLIKPFVQQVLGCQCPESVFSQIEHSLEPVAGTVYQRLLIGERLLIYLLDLSTVIDAEAVAGRLLRHGVAARDRAGLNRFRLVVIDGPDGLAGHLLGQMAGDDRVFFHAFTAEQLDPFFH